MSLPECFPPPTPQVSTNEASGAYNTTFVRICQMALLSQKVYSK